MRLVQVPTTLLAQVESAIGGKTAVNHPLAKNAIGAYHQPRLVLAEQAFLSTLSRREILCGLGEIVKYAMFEERVLSALERTIDRIVAGNPEATGRIVALCNAVKARLIQSDEREEMPGGGRAVLNLGHTIGHALEDLSHYRLRHGEAVIVGLRWELVIAANAGVLPWREAERYARLLNRIPYRPALRGIPARRLLTKVTAHAAAAGLVLPGEGRSVVVTRKVPPALIRSVIEAFLP